ncbi:MAG: arginine--tRNA ligase, partial [Eudoraea sp.]|nr:arginine--tRNA ligase [Eudoraea sp.]
MELNELLITRIKEAVLALKGIEIPAVELQPTRKDFTGDITLVVFPMLRYLKGNPEAIGQEIGAYLKTHVAEVADFNVIKGFLNLVISNPFYLNFFNSIKQQPQFGFKHTGTQGSVMVEYSSPNTNKPLHLGHLRNILLGYSVAEILKASGKKVYKTQIINDRGIHICKSMLAWKKFGNGETPESTGIKGDKFVGNYYVAFDKVCKEEIAELVAGGMDKATAEKQTPILIEAQEMLRKWESGDAETVALWKTMNGWVYEGFDRTYQTMGVDFDELYYESDTYLL